MNTSQEQPRSKKIEFLKVKSFWIKNWKSKHKLNDSNHSDEAKSAKSLSKSTSYVPSLITGSVDMFIHGAHEKSDDGGKWEETSESSDSFEEIPEANSEDEE